MWFIRVFKEDPSFAVLQVLIVIFSICLHEYMHARAALWQGDDTAKLKGHLTLNPFRQMGIFSLVLLFFVGIAFGKVPVNTARLRRPYGEAIVSFAGPFVNLMLSLIFFTGCVAVIKNTSSPDSSRFLVQVLFAGAELNAVLFMLNMIPVPPFDGFGIARSFFPALRTTSSEFMNGAYFFVLMVVFFSAQYLFMAADYTIINGFFVTGIDINVLRFYFA